MKRSESIRPPVPPPNAPEMLGPSLEKVARNAARLFRSGHIIMITGEAGVGKSLLAAFMHSAGPNSERSLVSINIATSGDRHQRLSLLGADFTHLTSSKRSLLELPTTVVIKHIDQAYPSLQERLATCLASGSISRPGSLRSKPLRCQLIFTMRKDAPGGVECSLLHPALAKILSTVPAIHIPPLRDRVGDCLSLARAYYGRPLPAHLEGAIKEHPWPGNVAELRAAIECLKPRRGGRGLPDRCRRELHEMLLRIDEGSEFSLRRSMAIIERGIIFRALKRTDGHRARAAQLLGLTDTALRWHIDRIRNS